MACTTYLIPTGLGKPVTFDLSPRPPAMARDLPAGGGVEGKLGGAVIEVDNPDQTPVASTEKTSGGASESSSGWLWGLVALAAVAGVGYSVTRKRA
jgi:MYXO-CTERM domain-containing protein